VGQIERGGGENGEPVPSYTACGSMFVGLYLSVRHAGRRLGGGPWRTMMAHDSRPLARPLCCWGQAREQFVPFVGWRQKHTLFPITHHAAGHTHHYSKVGLCESGLLPTRRANLPFTSRSRGQTPWWYQARTLYWTL